MRRLAILLLLAGCGNAPGAPGGTWEARGMRHLAAGDCPATCVGPAGPLLPGSAAAPECFVESEWSPGSQSFVWRQVCTVDGGRLSVTTRWGSSNTFADLEPDGFVGGCQQATVSRGGVAEEPSITCDVSWSRAE